MDVGGCRRPQRLLETDIVPTFYERDGQGIPHRWLAFVRQAIVSVGPQFSARRMVKQYADELYAPAVRSREAQPLV